MRDIGKVSTVAGIGFVVALALGATGIYISSNSGSPGGSDPLGSRASGSSPWRRWAHVIQDSSPAISNRLMEIIEAAANSAGLDLGSRVAISLPGDILRPEGIPTPKVDAPVGIIDGSFSVNSNGAAVYSIPIKVPPGIRGIEPQLSVTYNSQAGSGLLGVGWSLSGLSAIQRCPATEAQDGFIDPVDYDSLDRFCLDGQRLMSVQGTDGADGTVYHTERETWTRVKSLGAVRRRALLFRGAQQERDGARVRKTSDSVVLADGSTVPGIRAGCGR